MSSLDYIWLVAVLTGFQLGTIGRETRAWSMGVLQQGHLRHSVVTFLYVWPCVLNSVVPSGDTNAHPADLLSGSFLSPLLVPNFLVYEGVLCCDSTLSSFPAESTLEFHHHQDVRGPLSTNGSVAFPVGCELGLSTGAFPNCFPQIRMSLRSSDKRDGCRSVRA